MSGVAALVGSGVVGPNPALLGVGTGPLSSVERAVQVFGYVPTSFFANRVDDSAKSAALLRRAQIHGEVLLPATRGTPVDMQTMMRGIADLDIMHDTVMSCPGPKVDLVAPEPQHHFMGVVLEGQGFAFASSGARQYVGGNLSGAKAVALAFAERPTDENRFRAAMNTAFAFIGEGYVDDGKDIIASAVGACFEKEMVMHLDDIGEVPAGTERMLASPVVQEGAKVLKAVLDPLVNQFSADSRQAIIVHYIIQALLESKRGADAARLLANDYMAVMGQHSQHSYYGYHLAAFNEYKYARDGRPVYLQRARQGVQMFSTLVTALSSYLQLDDSTIVKHAANLFYYAVGLMQILSIEAMNNVPLTSAHVGVLQRFVNGSFTQEDISKGKMIVGNMIKTATRIQEHQSRRISQQASPRRT